MKSVLSAACLVLLAAAVPDPVQASPLVPRDIFELEYASEPEISPDGRRVVYVRNFMDIMSDRRRSNLWIIDAGGGNHRPLTSGEDNFLSPRWSPDGGRLAYISNTDGSRQLYVRWMDTGQVTKITRLERRPTGIGWSPDGKWIAFTMRVPRESLGLARMPPRPDGARWARSVTVIDTLRYREDGRGYLEAGFQHVFVVPAEGGTPRQVTSGDFNHYGPAAWTRDGKGVVVAANRRADWEYEPLDTEIYALSLADGALEPLTDRRGPDDHPVPSPDGRLIAYLGFDDRRLGFQRVQLYVMNSDGSDRRSLTAGLDRSVRSPAWSANGKGLYFQFADRGNGKIGYVSLAGKISEVAGDVGGTVLGRPYGGGSFSVARGGRIAYTITDARHPADLAVIKKGDSEARRLTRLNDDLLAQRDVGAAEPIEFPSRHDRRPIQGWVIKPPGFREDQRYPLILEIHGGPYSNYGNRFSAELQLYAAAGFVVLYVNPRGSTSYGEEFANLIQNDYPGNDYHDLMSGVDAVIAEGYIDPENLFVTGGSGGGTLTAWIVGKTDRFRAAAVAKPVINWYSWALTADRYNYFYRYWFEGPPWEKPEEYLRRSPLSLVGRVTTPTLVISGENDLRTPISEAEQYYQALKLRRIDTVLVRVPGSPHLIAGRPSTLIAKASNILAWFERYRTGGAEEDAAP